MTDQVIGYTEDGHAVYDNAASVSSVVVYYTSITGFTGVIAIRRAHNPGKGLLGLPGGFQMRGESWQEAGVREVFEETGLTIGTNLDLIFVVTDEYGHNLFVSKWRIVENVDLFLGGINVDPNEVEEAVWITKDNWEHFEDQWAFPLHKKAAKHVVFNGRN